MDNNNNNHLHDRREYDARVHRLEAVTETLANGVTQLTSDIHELSRIVRDSGKTNWSVLATWAGVVIAVVAALGNGFVIQPLSRLAEDFKTHTEYQMNLNDKEREWRRDFLVSNEQRSSTHEKDIEKLQAESEHSHARLHLFEDKITRDTISMAGLEQRVQAIERQVFAGTIYRSGRPDGHIATPPTAHSVDGL